MKNKRGIPKEFIFAKIRELCPPYEDLVPNIIYAEKNKIALCRQYKIVKYRYQSTGIAKIEEIIAFYNATKRAVDNMDRITENYTNVRQSSRLQYFI